MHCFKIRIYYEDTDAGGIVYYANYLKFAERARSEFLRRHGFSNSKMLDNDRIGVIVRHVEMDLKSPARLYDMLDIETRVIEQKRASFTMKQTISKNGLTLVTIIVKLACIQIDSGRPVGIPIPLQEILKNDNRSHKPD
jgi:acyl-CoA thioester hydrolase